jgi:probable addiction module antidote protein
MDNFRKYKDTLIEDLRDKKYAKTYLAAALEEYEKDNNVAVFLTALRDVAEAQGGVTKLSKKTHLNRPHLYRVLSHRGNPSLYNVDRILHGLGFKLTIDTLKDSRPSTNN